MRKCPTCGLPRTQQGRLCPYCGVSIDGAGSYELLPFSLGFRLRADESIIASLTRSEEVLQIRLPGALSSDAYCLIAQNTPHVLAVVLNRALHPYIKLSFEHDRRRERLSGGVIEVPGSGAFLELRVEGDLGLRIVRPDGSIEALASPKESGTGRGLDIVLVAPDPSLVPLGYFGIFSLALVVQARFARAPLRWDEGEGHSTSVDIDA